jgi:hypothetical protein
MQSKRPITRATQELSDRLRADDVDVSPRAIERWQQDFGLIQSTDRKWIPREGSESSYGLAAETQARQVRHLLDQGLTLNDVVVRQFMRGRYVATSQLKRVLLARLRRALGPPSSAKTWVEAKPEADATGFSRAERLARKREAEPLRHALYDAGRVRGERINQTVARLTSTMFLVFLAGEPHTRKELQHVLAAAGLDANALDMDAIARQLSNMKQSELEKRIDTATRIQLDRAAENAKLLRAYAERSGIELAASQPEHDAVVQVVTMLQLRHTIGPDLDLALKTLNLPRNE